MSPMIVALIAVTAFTASVARWILKNRRQSDRESQRLLDRMDEEINEQIKQDRHFWLRMAGFEPLDDSPSSWFVVQISPYVPSVRPRADEILQDDRAAELFGTELVLKVLNSNYDAGRPVIDDFEKACGMPASVMREHLRRFRTKEFVRQLATFATKGVYAVLADDERLLRPSAAPSDQTLLIPAVYTQSDHDHLLRPANNE